MSYHRIMIIGSGGAGKSTLSRQIHEITGLPIFHLDKYYWKPNWIESDKHEWEKTVQALTNQDVWIMDGNYGGTMDIRLEKADTIIFLNLSRWVCLRRVIIRTILSYGKSRQDMTPGCPERFSWEFLQYIWNYPATRSPHILKKLEGLSNSKNVIILESPGEVKNFLKSLPQKSG